MDTVKIKKGLKNPKETYKYLASILKGLYYKLKYIVLRKNVQIGKGFRVRKNLSIKGSGKVIMGNYVFVNGTSHDVTPWTYDKKSTIVIGNSVVLNGTRFGCKKRIEIGDNCILADCRIIDTDFHSIVPEKRNDPDKIRVLPVKIGKNVWIAMDCAILPGVTIGDNTTITAKSVVINDIPENTVYGGNPAVFIKNATPAQLLM